MPGTVANAVCGPTVSGTTRPADMSTLVDLNLCPLNVCCNVWGQCGITQDFCVPSPADTGAPGTAKLGSNGCVSSCNMMITNNEAPPASFKKVGYWEAWNGQRSCLHMKASQIDTTQYTLIHFAFATISATFDVSIGNFTSEFADFKAISGVKRILSFGGWSFSTDYDTFPIFRQSVTVAQRQAVATKVVAFVVNKGLDGVDFDWEYPGAPDIGVPPGSPQDGPNYLNFLQLVRAGLPAGKTISLAAPALFWYLKGFPIADMSKVVDYIVYMTYDMHGQWDYGNAWSDDGCPGGNCLRSHINKTETTSALAMITYAGVQASKVVASGATPSRCTGTAGYISNFEIRELIETVGNVQQYSIDEGDILVHDSV
ncbi:hypothetical protein VE02_05172 [Pseudogymnoascus sp. 03VT05]|nr:hypothetical protein VE02_05172 [Pseudogymnoascus sp. 03VT05]